MQFPILNLFQKFNETTPIGLSSMGITKKNKKLVKKKNKTILPSFFKFDRISPVAN